MEKSTIELVVFTVIRRRSVLPNLD